MTSVNTVPAASATASPEADDEPVDGRIADAQRGADRSPSAEDGGDRAAREGRGDLLPEVDADQVGRGRGDGIAVGGADLGRHERDDDGMSPGAGGDAGSDAEPGRTQVERHRLGVGGTTDETGQLGEPRRSGPVAADHALEPCGERRDPVVEEVGHRERRHRAALSQA